MDLPKNPSRFLTSVLVYECTRDFYKAKGILTNMYEDTLNIFTRRRSVREYTNQPVEKEKIDIILKAAMAAPSACNTQPWEIIITQEETLLKELRSVLPMGKYIAPCAITVCGNTQLCRNTKEMWVQDCSAAMQNILLAATALDLASIWIGVYLSESVHPLVDKVSRVLNIPKHVVPLGIAYIGYSDQIKEPRTQYNDKRCYYEVYDDTRKHRARPKDLKHAK